MHLEDKRKVTPAGLVHLFIVYFVWGSTYLAIRIGIRSGAGFEPFWFGGMRVFTAGIILLGWGLIRGKNLRLSKKDLLILAGSGFLLWIGGNGLVVWAEQQVNSGIAALVVATIPIWVAFLDSILDSRIPTLPVILSLIVGFLGIFILSLPVLTSGIRADLLSILALLLASFSWSAGLVLQTRHPVALNRGVSSGYQQLFGGIFFAVIALIVREPLPTPTTQAWLAWGYLVIFGSVIAFTSFVTALQILPTRLVTTYSYVNPVIAVLLGWLILSEPITYWTIAGGVLVLIGVTGIYWANSASKGPETRGQPG
ncbi:MAG: EamA family transporter [Anaerolineales bacterium]|nr:EamA family transporter [Anaerolineales bacterium]